MKTLHMNVIELRVDLLALRNLVSEDRIDSLELFFACPQKAVTLGLGHSASKPKGFVRFTRVVFHVFLCPE